MALMAKAPNSLDPAVANNSEALEADWLAYTPLLTYRHSDGQGGTEVVAGLAQTLPAISNGGKVYTFTLYPGLKYSNGQPLRAADFRWAVERAIKLWPEARRLIEGDIVGAASFASGRAKTISGIATDEATGQITIRLTAPDGAFENVLALPALAPVPTGTPFTEQHTPPPGVGPYALQGAVPGRSFTLIRNPAWRKYGVQDVPPAHLDVDVRITGNPTGNALSVLHDTADAFDWPDPISPTMLGTIQRRASSRFFRRTVDATDLIFLNVTRRPFSSQLARVAVRAGLDQNVLGGLASGNLLNGCYVLPPSVYGHPNAACPDGNKAGDGNLALAKSLVRRSGMIGSRVLVWSPASSPIRQWMGYYSSLLDRIGFRASLKVVPDARYQAMIGDAKGNPQTGYGELFEQVPNPVSFYAPLTGEAISRTGNRNWSRVDDPQINSTVRVLAGVPAGTVGAVGDYWARLELYVAEKGYVAVLGYPRFPEFVSSRIDFGKLIFSPVAGYDWSSFQLN
jgi:peptide/nickel transport system substrate-binding protein